VDDSVEAAGAGFDADDEDRTTERLSMARFEFKLPDIGEGVTEGEIVAWGDGVAVGARVEVDQTLAEVMTDKATVTIPSPKAGVIVHLGGEIGSVLSVGAVLVVIETEGAAGVEVATAESAQRDALPKPSKASEPMEIKGQTPVAPSPKPAPVAPSTQDDPSKTKEGPSATAAGSIPEVLPGMQEAAAEKPLAMRSERPLAAPATRKLARELGVDLTQVAGSGPNGRVTQQDVQRFAEQKSAGTSIVKPAVMPVSPMSISSPEGVGQALEERIPLRGMRKAIFHQMARSKHTAAHFTFVEECHVTALKALRERMRPLAEAEGVKLTFLPFIIKACVAALKRHPMLNAAYDEVTDEIVLRYTYNIGVAAATEAGLMVPVVKGAENRSLMEISKEIQRLSEDAQAGKIARADLMGSTFTITSLGAVGGLFATPILNFPEVAILGVHQIKQKPVVVDGNIVIGDVMLLSLSFDHRIIDGHVGAAFAYEVIRYLENPDKLMLEMG
jgi:pyruvate dehydrogenase E2 component (dihydrolipoamide acetyltransferase)